MLRYSNNSRTTLIVFVFSLLIIGITSCNKTDSKQSDIVNIDIINSINNSKDYKLSDFVKEVEAIRLDTSKDGYIPYISNLTIGDNLILVSGTETVKVFTRAGKFVRNIGAKGKGPGEYLLTSAQMDHSEKYVFISDDQLDKLLKYSIDGNFIKEINLREYIPSLHFGRLRFVEDDQLAVAVRRYSLPTEEFFSVVTFDLDLNIKNKVLKRPNDENLLLDNLRRYRMEPINYGLMFWETYFDTIYHINPDGEVKPKYHFKISKNGLTHQELSSPMGYSERLRSQDICFVYNVWEIPNFLLIEGIYPGFKLIHHIQNGETYSITRPTFGASSNFDKIPSMDNDLYGIEPVYFDFYQSDINCLLKFYRSWMLEEDLDIQKIKQKEVLFPAIRDKIIDMVNSEVGGIIIMILKLKS